MVEPHNAMAIQLDSNVKTLSPRATTVVIGLLIGALGGTLQGLLLASSVGQSLLGGVLFGATFGLFFAKRATSAGAGLIWGLAFAVLVWIVFPAGVLPLLAGAASQLMLTDAREQFPQLVALLICLGAPVGLAVGLWSELRTNTSDTKFNWRRAIVAGGLAGTLGGLIFGRWVSSGDYFPLLAGYGALNFSRATIILLHFGVAAFIGVTFGLLFQRDVRGYGSCMGWGLGYAIFWWFLAQLHAPSSGRA